VAFVTLESMSAPTAVRTKSERLESRENRWLKRFRAALQERPDEQATAVGVEGPRLVEEALRSGLETEALLVADSGEKHLSRLKGFLPAGLRVLRTSDRLFASVAGTETPQGIALLVAPRIWRIEEMLGSSALVVVLAGVQDPGNVGTIVRAAEGFGATGVIACRGSAHPLAPKSLRASAGSVFRVPTMAGASPENVMTELRRHSLRQYAATMGGEQSAPLANFREPCAIWIGSEGSGLPSEIERGADARVRIPTGAEVQSLNAAIAAAVLLYEAARQRGNTGHPLEPSRDKERTPRPVGVPRQQ
jgi:RNA methyltransferase, TrmH family